MNRRSANVLLTAFLMACAAALLSLSTGCAGPADPLRHLAQSADLIVLADVERVLESPPAAAGTGPAMPPGTDRIARLRVLETWKGRAVSRLDVPFNVYLKWPAPPRYVAGETVVAFLRRAGAEWTTVGMSAGTIAMRGTEIAELRAQVGEILASLKLMERRRLDWSDSADSGSGGRDAAGSPASPGVAPTPD